ncbi:MAG: 50S ribosomal protein L22 [Dehalococcoidia bacterium]|nr:MAG: 50S ribosomal protein L22 [Dehalococcoidia bacterium]
MKVKVVAKDIGMPSRKVRRYVDLVRGQKVEEALAVLRFMPSPAARAVAKAVKSAAANAENNYQTPLASLRIVAAYVDEGRTLKRFRPQARGRISPILKRSSHVTVLVEED